MIGQGVEACHCQNPQHPNAMWTAYMTRQVHSFEDIKQQMDGCPTNVHVQRDMKAQCYQYGKRSSSQQAFELAVQHRGISLECCPTEGTTRQMGIALPAQHVPTDMGRKAMKASWACLPHRIVPGNEPSGGRRGGRGCSLLIRHSEPDGRWQGI